MGPVCKKVSVPAEGAGERLDRFALGLYPGESRARVQDWIRQGLVRVNGADAKASERLRPGDTVEVEPAPPAPLRAEPESIPLKIVYEDDDLLAVDKPAGMVVHAGAGVHAGTLVNALLGRFASLSTVGGELRPGIVHRLDRYTSGLLLVAKHDQAHRLLAAQFAAREVEKIYLTLAHGQFPAAEGRIEKPIARDPVRRVRMTARLERGRPASTFWRVLRRFAGFTFLEVRIGTGRTHQIRVHLANIGHPVAGDRLYGAPAQTSDREPLERYFLHSHRIRFRQPLTGEWVELVSPLPEELRSWMEDLPPGGGPV
jgi:23S rRNA pseudouridine1911/1915/1917 synthase